MTTHSAPILPLLPQARWELPATCAKNSRLGLHTRSQKLMSKMKQFLASPQWQVEAVSQKLKPKMASIKHKQSKTKRDVAAPQKPATGVPSLFLRIAGRTSKHMARQLKVAILQPAKQDLFLFMPHQAKFNSHRQLLVCHVGTEEVHPWVSKTKHFSDAWNGFKELPPAPPCQCWRHKREKSNAPACAQSKRPFVDARSNIEIPGARGYTSSNNEI